MKYILEEDKGAYRILRINRPKVNALNMDLVNEIRAAFKGAEEDEKIRGVILTGLPGVFSAGLDLIELYDYDEPKMRAFFIAFGSMYIELAKFTKIFICAISGHSPAGGTVIAVTADYRIMAEGEDYGIGLNEVAVNVQITSNLIDAYSFWIGKQAAYDNVLSGRLLDPQTALKQGLVNEVCSYDQLLPLAEKQMKHYLHANHDILIKTKAKLRKDWLDRLNTDALEDLEESLKIWWSPEVRLKMQMFKALLKAKKEKS